MKGKEGVLTTRGQELPQILCTQIAEMNVLTSVPTNEYTRRHIVVVFTNNEVNVNGIICSRAYIQTQVFWRNMPVVSLECKLII